MIHAAYRQESWRASLWLLALLAGMGVLWWLPAPDAARGLAGYLPLHTLLEVLAIAMAAMVFGVSWATQKYRPNGRVLTLGVGFLGVAMLDLGHALSYAGMPDFITPNSVEKAINFWLAARLLAALALLAVAYWPARADLGWRQGHRLGLLGGVLLAVTTVFALFLQAPEWLPRTFVEGQGLTAFKVGFEYGLIALYALAGWRFLQQMDRPRTFGVVSLALASLTMALSEYFFTLYANVSDLYNLAGHVYKIIAYGFLYRGLFVETVQKPYQDLLVSEAQQLATLETLPDLLFEVDHHGVYLEIHASEPDKLAAPPEALLGRSIRDMLPAAAVATCFEAIGEARAHGISRGRRISIPLASGEVRHFELSVAAKPRQAEAEPTFLVLSRDITPTVQNERQLTREAALKEALFDLQQHQFLEDEAHWLRRVQDHARQLSGSACAFVRLVPLPGAATVFPLEDNLITAPQGDPGLALASGVCAQVLAQRSPWLRNDLAAEDPDTLPPPCGDRPWQRLLVLPALDAHQVRLLLAVGNAPQPYGEQDVLLLQRLADTVWRLWSQTRQEAVIHRLSEALAQSPNPVVITDTAARIQYVNRAFTDSSGYSADEVMGQNPRVLKSGETPDDTYQGFWRQLTQGLPWQGEFINRRKDGMTYIEKASVYPIRDAFGRLTHYVAHKEDITLRRAAELRIRDLSEFDVLTGLLNKKAFDERLAQAVDLARERRERVSLLWFDLDNFKVVNDTLGHSVGDELLVEMAKRLRHTFGNGVPLARHSGDTFVAIVAKEEQARVALMATEALTRLQAPLTVQTHRLSLGASVGVAVHPNDALTPGALASAAEVAMYRVKQEGRNGLRFFAPDMQEHTRRSLDLAGTLKDAQERGELRLVYQPQRRVGDGALVGAEALLRWHHPRWGLVSPAEFIPIAEQTGLIVPIGLWVLEQAARQWRAWAAAGLHLQRIAVNVSAVQFARPGLVEELLQVLRQVEVSADHIEIEMTEAVALKNPEQAGALIQRLHVAGFRVSLDDFGTGYSSMSYLKRYAIDKLKIDQSFVKDLVHSESDRAIVTAIVQMAHSLRMTTLAEGVETEAQARLLQACGCDEIQGYVFSRPLDAAAFEAFARQRPA